ncbi:hypothetical protein [Acaryochloris marina]|uniref:hypothetical protein n=1 Tax=Acaryochloris marina TaxID=155978 RepID=UPI0005A123E3|nr:hypothetical protein [Acaryochloris marina]BDM78928.1 hypothetical protein AM10699_17960 [Acaryochloris marina MBIC10699]
MQYSNQFNSNKDKSKEEDEWFLFREKRYSPIIDTEWPIRRQQAYGPIIDEFQDIFEEGFEPKIGKLLKIFLYRLFNHAAPHK